MSHRYGGSNQNNRYGRGPGNNRAPNTQNQWDQRRSNEGGWNPPQQNVQRQDQFNESRQRSDSNSSRSANFNNERRNFHGDTQNGDRSTVQDNNYNGRSDLTENTATGKMSEYSLCLTQIPEPPQSYEIYSQRLNPFILGSSSDNGNNGGNRNIGRNNRPANNRRNWQAGARRAVKSRVELNKARLQVEFPGLVKYTAYNDNRECNDDVPATTADHGESLYCIHMERDTTYKAVADVMFDLDIPMSHVKITEHHNNRYVSIIELTAKYDFMRYWFFNNKLTCRRDKAYKYQYSPMVTCHFVKLRDANNWRYNNSPKPEFDEWLAKAHSNNVTLETTLRSRWEFLPSDAQLKKGVVPLISMTHLNLKTMDWNRPPAEFKTAWLQTCFYDRGLNTLQSTRANKISPKLGVVFNEKNFTLTSQEYADMGRTAEAERETRRREAEQRSQPPTASSNFRVQNSRVMLDGAPDNTPLRETFLAHEASIIRRVDLVEKSVVKKVEHEDLAQLLCDVSNNLAQNAKKNQSDVAKLRVLNENMKTEHETLLTTHSSQIREIAEFQYLMATKRNDNIDTETAAFKAKTYDALPADAPTFTKWTQEQDGMDIQVEEDPCDTLLAPSEVLAKFEALKNKKGQVVVKPAPPSAVGGQPETIPRIGARRGLTHELNNVRGSPSSSRKRTSDINWAASCPTPSKMACGEDNADGKYIRGKKWLTTNKAPKTIQTNKHAIIVNNIGDESAKQFYYMLVYHSSDCIATIASRWETSKTNPKLLEGEPETVVRDFHDELKESINILWDPDYITEIGLANGMPIGACIPQNITPTMFNWIYNDLAKNNTIGTVDFDQMYRIVFHTQRKRI